MRGFVFFLGGLSFTALSWAATPKAAKDETIPTVNLPNYEINEHPFDDPPLFKKIEIVPPDFSTKTAPLFAQYPGHAFYEGEPNGTASVGVMLDREGKATDFLLLRYTKDYFGASLLRAAQRQLYSPRGVMGVPVPGRFNFTYAFRPPTRMVIMSSFDAITERNEEVSGGPKFIYEPHNEKEIDGGQLEPVRMPIPRLPASYKATATPPPRLVITFYVDEKGRVRLPNVESAPAADLVGDAIAAALDWEFKPPTIKGKGVLVYTARTLAFRDER